MREGLWSSSRGFAAAAPVSAEELRRLVEEARTPRKAKQIGTQKTSRVLGDGTGFWRCSDCGIEKGAADFRENGRGRLFSYCKKCERERKAAHNQTLRGNATVLVANAKHRSRLKGRSCVLDIDFILDMILQQEARCAYSGVLMELLLPYTDWRMSLERLDNKEGYEPWNCVLIAAEFNTAGMISKRAPIQAESGSSKWSLQKVQNLAAERLSNVDLLRLNETIKAARAKNELLPLPDELMSLHCKLEAVPGYLRCSRCGLWKQPDCFSLRRDTASGFQKHCKQCSSHISYAHRMTLRGHVLELLRSARHRHGLGKWRGEFDLDLEYVLQMLWAQQGRCFYSDVPLRFAQLNTDWLMSLERLDNNLTYTKNNTVLVALEFNTPGNSSRAKLFPVLGSGQWSRNKVEHVWGTPNSFALEG